MLLGYKFVLVRCVSSLCEGGGTSERRESKTAAVELLQKVDKGTGFWGKRAASSRSPANKVSRATVAARPALRRVSETKPGSYAAKLVWSSRKRSIETITLLVGQDPASDELGLCRAEPVP